MVPVTVRCIITLAGGTGEEIENRFCVRNSNVQERRAIHSAAAASMSCFSFSKNEGGGEGIKSAAVVRDRLKAIRHSHNSSSVRSVRSAIARHLDRRDSCFGQTGPSGIDACFDAHGPGIPGWGPECTVDFTK